MERLRRSMYIMLIIGLSITFLYIASSLVLPLALAGLLAMLFRGLSNRLENRGYRRWLTALISVGIFISVLAIIGFLLTWQLSTMNESLGDIQQRLTEKTLEFRDWIQKMAGISHAEQKVLLEEQAGAASDGAGKGLATFALGTLGVLVDFILVIVYMYLLLFYRTKIKNFILMVTPEKSRKNTMVITGDASQVAQQYLLGLVSMIGVLWGMYGIGFSIIGVQGALFFAVLCGLLEIVPFIGNLLGTSITLIAVLAQGGDSGMVLGVIAVYFVVQGVQTYILEPLIVGKQVNINPLFTIIALVAGEMLWGIAGMILAIPLVGIIKIICDQVASLRPYGFLIGSEDKIDKNSKK